MLLLAEELAWFQIHSRLDGNARPADGPTAPMLPDSLRRCLDATLLSLPLFFFNLQLCITCHPLAVSPRLLYSLSSLPPKLDSPILYIAYSLAWYTIESMEGLAYRDVWGGKRIQGRQQQHPSS